MISNGKWLEGIAPDADVADAARKALGDRLAAVLYWLPPAAYCADLDIEHVHRLRVSTRRAAAAWQLFHSWLPPKRARRVKKWLKQVRKAAGEARDLDVLSARLERQLGDDGKDVVAQFSDRRARVQPAIVQVADRARRHDRLAGEVEKLLSGIKPCCNKRSCEECAPFQKWARKQLDELAGEFFDGLPASDDEPSELHQFRIRAKALRYAIELLASAFDDELRYEHYPVVEELQERLGGINDHATATERLNEWSESADDAVMRRKYRDLAQEESQRLKNELRAFREWWTPERVASLRRGLASDTGQPEARTVLSY